jgi:uncharacterized protein involved in outer membrane biogenesis
MSDPSAAPARPSRLWRVVRPFLWVALALALYAGLGFVGVPLLVQHQAPPALGDLLGRKLTVDKIRFNPFTLTAELRGVKIMAREGEVGSSDTPALSFDHLLVNFEIQSLWYGGPVVQELALNGLKIRLTRIEAERFDWSDVFERLAELSTDDDAPPLPFSIANIHVRNGLIEVDDRVADTTHQLTVLKLGIPVLSRLPVTVDAFIEPDLVALIDGRPLAAKGRLELLPNGFSGTLEQLSVKDFELAPWLVYSPVTPTFRLPSGTLNLDLRVEFKQVGSGQPTVRLQGKAQINQLAVQDRSGAPALAAAELELELADVQPLAGRYYFSRLRLQQPAIDLVRLADGDINLAHLLPAASAKAGKEKGTKSARAEAAATTGVDFLLSSARVRDGLVRYSDNAVEGGFSSRVESINLDLRDLSTSSDVPAEISFEYMTAAGEKFSHQDHLRLNPFSYDGNVTVEGFQAGIYRRYYNAFLPGGEVRNGRVDGAFRYRIAEQDDTDDLLIEVGIERFELSDFALALNGRKGELLKLDKLAVTDARILPETHAINVGEVSAQGVVLGVTRLPAGRYDFMALTGTPSSRPAARAAAPEPPWTFQLDKAAVEGSSLRFEDRTGAEPVVVTADGIDIQLSELSTAKGAKRASLVVKSRLNKGGRLAVKGTLAPEPFATDLDVNLQSFGLAALQPYVLQQAQLGIKGGALSLKGRLALQQRRDKLHGSLSGDVLVNDFFSTDRRTDSDFVRWREFAVKQARVDLEPFALAINEMVIDGLRSRLILEQDGRLNLREIQRSPQEAQAIAAQGSEVNAGAAADTGNATQSSDVAPDVATGAPAAPLPPVRVGRISVRNSNIAFSDRFVRPNYNAFLANLTGDLTGLSSDQDSMAKLDLQGRVGQSAGLTIKGEFNPFRQDRHLNIEADVKDFELTDLSGYSGRYIGYGISRGKLSATVNYHVENRKLSAENHVILDQLTFGDAIESPDATKLPVRLAVALLKNSRGEIDINLPVSGTLDDPEFSVFGLVMRALAGLISKAVTAPFALLGREELSQVDFAPGSARIGAEQEEKLRSLAKTLAERSALKLDITGLVNADRDTEGVRRNKLRDMVRAEKRKAVGGKNAAGQGGDDLSDEDYAAYLGDVYDDAQIKKPRNFLGLSKSLPVSEMEKLLLANIAVDEEDIVALAHRREAVVQRWLGAEGKISAERLFPRVLTEAEVKDGGRKGNGVRFSLR